MKNLRGFLLLLLSLSGLFGFSQTISIINKKFVVNGNASCPIYFNGANTPWNSWNDFGGSYSTTKWAQDMADLKSKGINAARIWFSCNGDGQPSVATDGTVSAPSAAFWTNCDHLFTQAQNNGVYIMATLMSFDHTKTGNNKAANWRAMMSDTAKIRTYINNYLIPFVNRYKTNPYFFSVDLCNEIEWIVEDNTNWQTTYPIIQRFVAMCAVAMHSSAVARTDGSKVLVTMGSAATKWNASKSRTGSFGTGWQNNSTGNKWSDAALQAQYNNPNAYLDYYSPHFYGWVSEYYSNPFEASPTTFGMDEKACLVGEMPARDPFPIPTSSTVKASWTMTNAMNAVKTLGWQGHFPWTANITTNLTEEVGSLADFGAAALAFKTANAALVVPACAVNTAPTVSLTAPTNNATFAALATVSLTATATDSDGTISKVEFYNGTTLLGSDATSPYAYSWTSVAQGSYSITAIAYDNAGATKTSTAVAIVVNAPANNTPPSAVITAPHCNAYFQQASDITIKVYSTDFGGTYTAGTVSKVEFFNGTTKLGESTTATSNTYTYVWTAVPAGTYTIKAKATDNLGGTFTSAGVIITVGAAAVTSKGLSACKGKYLANIIPSSIRADYGTYWNGVSAENSCKWGSVEATRDVMNWTQADIAYNYAKNNNLMFRYHAIAWGSQYPSWITTLNEADFKAEMEEYMAAIAARYPLIDQIDVLNENMYLNTWNGNEHAAGTPYFRAGMGGPGTTGYDWIIWLFEKARFYFPNAKLVMNDFELENNTPGINEMLNAIKVLRDRGLIDGFGTQAHCFNVDGVSAANLLTSINTMDNAGVPVYVTELDLNGGSTVSEATQLTSYTNLFPVYWNHAAVGGITIWGYVEGATWQTGTGILNADGTKRSSMTWLETYIAGRTDVGYPMCSNGTVNPPATNILLNGEFDNGTTSWDMQYNSSTAGTFTVVTNATMSGTNAAKICPTTQGTANWHVQLRQNAPIEANKEYEISFVAKADAARTMDIGLQMEGDPYTSYYGAQQNLTTANQSFSYTYTPTVTDPTVKLKFYVGGNATCVYIDKVVFQSLTPAIAPLATITAASSTTFCSGGSVILNANTGTGYTYQWKKDGANITNATLASYTATLAGAYTVVVTSSGLSTTSVATNVVVNTIPATPIITSNSPICAGNTMSLSIPTTTGATYSWTGPSAYTASTASISRTASTVVMSGIYSVTQTVNGCTSLAANHTFVVNTIPSAPAVVSPINYDLGATATVLTATGSNLLWYTVPTSGSSSITAPIPTTNVIGSTNYYVSQTVNACESSRALINVVVAKAIVQQSIQLAQGWNIISSNVNPTDSTIETLFGTLQVDQIKNADGFWKKGQATNLQSLTKIEAGKGYLVFMKASGTLTISGYKMPIPTTIIPLKTGWNLLGCPYQSAVTLSSLFDATNTETVKNFDGFWKPNDALSSILNLQPGKGYYILKK